MALLGVNIDHVATLRQQRRSGCPDLLLAAAVCEEAGADSIVVHLREDRRHIQDHDVVALRRAARTRLNLEMSVSREIVKIACRVKPDQATLVPEKRRELTTEGGLDVRGQYRRIAQAIEFCSKALIPVSLFIEPDDRQIKAAHRLGAQAVEFHTGRYADARSIISKKRQLARMKRAVEYAHDLGLTVNAGHGLDYSNICPIVSLGGIHELNIGFSIVAQAIFVGLEKAVSMMKSLVSSGEEVFSKKRCSE